MECCNCRFALKLHVFTVTVDAMEETLRHCAGCLTHISSPLKKCRFGFICDRVVRIDGDPTHICTIVFGNVGAFIF